MFFRSPSARRPELHAEGCRIGNQVQLSDYRGQGGAAEFLGDLVRALRVEIPWFIDFEKNYKDKGFAVVGVSFDEEGWAAVGP